jgi:hypothetical protein
MVMVWRSVPRRSLAAVLVELSLLLSLVGGVATVPQQSLGDYPQPNKMNVLCATEHCGAQMIDAFADPVFRDLMAGMEACNGLYWNSTDPGRLAFQNCTQKANFEWPSVPGQKFLACAMTNNCIQFAPLNVTCPKPKVKVGTSLADLKGRWQQRWGYNKLWDAYPCQNIWNMSLVDNADFCSQTPTPAGPVQAPCWSYDYSYEVFNETGLVPQHQVWQLPSDTPLGAPIDIYYTYVGSLHNETWYILEATDRYVVLLDCSYMAGETNVGSILWVRPEVDELTPAEMTAVGAAYLDAGLPADSWTFPRDFLEDKWRDCKEPPLPPPPNSGH